MAEMTIRLIPDPSTGKKNIIISLTGDEESLPHEHEQAHRALVEKVIGSKLVKLEELGNIEVERLEEQKAPAAPASSPEGERQAQGQGN
jgi:hypothetical protein